jgi:hypothetical protein
MGHVMIKCPRTGQQIRTGMVAEPGRFASTPVFFARVLCPICLAEHEWFAKDAWVSEVVELPEHDEAAA